MKLSNYRECLRRYAYKNAITLVLFAIMFAITWIVIIAANVWEAAHAH